MQVILAGPAHPLRGGLAAFNERLAREFKSQGHDIRLWSFSLQYPSFLFPGKTQFSSSPAPQDLVIESVINSVNPMNWIRVGLKLRQLKPDLLILRYWIPFMAPSLGTIARIARTNRHTRVIPIIDNILPHERHWFDTPLGRYFTGSCDAFVTMSKEVMKDLEQFDQKKPRNYCPHPLYDNYGQILSKEKACHLLGLDPEWTYLLFFGFIREYKGLDLLLHAFAHQGFADKKVKLLIAGEFYTNPEPYLKIIESHPFKDRILLYDRFIADNEVNLYFSATDLVVQPYKSATQSGVSQIAVYFEKPIVLTDVGGLAEQIPDGIAGRVTKPSADSIAVAMMEFIDVNRREEYMNNLRQLKQQYSWSRMVESFETLIRN
ncbi:MAG: glycosyltransferase [Bacteroidales bacterium]|jgi:glycosyltransferase involved in cell wall biosynthesis|nr:glycosyltransferase [Bacteroidales bacterium]NPV36515.1 glycosyltransferase [Bacteroidales bacterium]